MKTALDSSVLSAIWSAEPSVDRVKKQLVKARAEGGIVICAVVYAELAAHPLVSPGIVDRLLAEADITVEFDLDAPIWRKAADGFAAYAQRRRRSGGTSPKRLLPDFLIAAHALLSANRLLTLDPSRYQQDFPQLHLM
jgi:predicted nucleic acid-binding protein